MRRRLLNLLTALSLLLSATVVALWAVDHGGLTSREVMLALGHRAYGLFLDGDNFFCGVFVLHGEGGIALDARTDYRYTRSFYCLSMLMEKRRIWNHLGGFGAVRVADRPRDEIYQGASILMFPWWVAPAVLLPLPTIRLARLLRKHRRSTDGRCPACGYDLRATPERCPECGAAAKAPA